MKLAAYVLVALVHASAVAQASHPALLVLNKVANELAIANPATGEVVARVPVGLAPHEVVATADGDRAVVSNYGDQQPGSSLSLIDVRAQKEIKRVDLGELRRPHGLAVSGREVYFTVEGNKAVGRLNVDTTAIDWLMGTGQNTTHMVVLSQDADTLFTSNIGSDTVSVLHRRPAGDWQVTNIPVGKGPEGIDLSPSGKELWVAQSQDGGVSIIDVAAQKVTQTLALHTKRSNRLKFTPDGKLVLVSDLGGGDVVVIDANTRREVKRLHLGGQPEGILMQPDGARAYVALWEDNVVAILDLAELKVVGKISTGKGPDGMAWIR